MRWVSRDPIGYEGGVNLFEYVGSNPVGYVDPSGRNAVVIGIGFGAEAGAGAGAVFGPPGAVAGAVVGGTVGGLAGWWAGNRLGQWLFSKPPSDAYDPQGPKAPGKPRYEDGFCDPKEGESWVRNPNGRGYGWEDGRGDVWVPTGKGGRAHGGPHWDVQTPGKGYRNVRPKQ